MRPQITCLYTRTPSCYSNSRNHKLKLTRPRIDIFKTSIAFSGAFLWCDYIMNRIWMLGGVTICKSSRIKQNAVYSAMGIPDKMSQTCAGSSAMGLPDKMSQTCAGSSVMGIPDKMSQTCAG